MDVKFVRNISIVNKENFETQKKSIQDGEYIERWTVFLDKTQTHKDNNFLISFEVGQIDSSSYIK